ncbi:MAG: response regulator [Anaerolineae bacterium]
MSVKKRILYIDDNHDHLLIVKAMLERDGYTCQTCADAEQALTILQAEPFDLVLLDLQLPKISGIELLEQIKTQLVTSLPIIIAITANSTIFAQHSPYQLGFDGYLSKPIMPADLSRVIKQAFTASTG